MHDNSNIILHDQFADFDTSMRLKQLGFNEGCLRYYDKDGRQCQSVCASQDQYTEQVCSAPLLWQVGAYLFPNGIKDIEELRKDFAAEVKERHSKL
jgi:hypothetical protein